MMDDRAAGKPAVFHLRHGKQVGTGPASIALSGKPRSGHFFLCGAQTTGCKHVADAHPPHCLPPVQTGRERKAILRGRGRASDYFSFAAEFWNRREGQTAVNIYQ